MFGSKNQITLAGNVGREPEIKEFENGSKVGNFSIAESESWTDSSGQQQERTNWYRVVVRNTAVLRALEKVSKGDKVLVEGQLQTRKYTDGNGQEQRVTEVIVAPYTGGMDFLPKSSGRVNEMRILGNLTRDPEAITFTNGEEIVVLSVATSEVWRDKTSGESKQRPEYHRVVIRDPKAAEIAKKYMKMGMKVWVSGRLEVREYTDKDNNKRSVVETVLRPNMGGRIQMLSGVKEREDGTKGEEPEVPSDKVEAQIEGYSQENQIPENSFDDLPPNSMDDEIPF